MVSHSATDPAQEIPANTPATRATNARGGQVSRAQASLAISPLGGYDLLVAESNQHATHPGLIKRLKRADGHLRHVIDMIQDGRPCADIAVQLQAVEKAVTAAKRTLIHDHIDHCLGVAGEADLAEMKTLAKLL